ncbi:thioredoxin [Candidatus Epulonipiscium viviparus]|uniref:thioredoxin n=2 Tax=Candidatus Epulonipiscium viviparus TaxID=420336 RepID=UPI0027380A12|nr:thioredoxin [Candidatus Epulopiscium viviparus]
MAFEFTVDNFQEEALDSDIPVMVDFYADWCAPCRMIAPIINELAEEYENKVKIGKLNIDEHSEISNRYGIMSIPTILFIKNGEVINKVQGAVPKTKLNDTIQTVLK